MIKVSVIIPIYNSEAYLEKCLQSVINQTLKEIELICVNDGSTDNSLEILQRYALKYNNIIVINQENCGVGKSRNKGIDIAKGKFVAFMDSDDFYPDYDVLECLYNSAIENDVHICGGSLSMLKGEKIINDYYGWLQDFTFESDCIMNYFEYQFSAGFTRFIYNLDFLKKNNLYFPTYSIYEDPPFFVKSMACAHRFYAMKKFTYCYRVGHKTASLSLKKTIDYAKGVLDVLNISKEYRFDKLHTIVVNKIHEVVSPAIYKYVAEGNMELLELLNKINNSIDHKLLNQENEMPTDLYLLDYQSIVRYVEQNRKKETEFINTLKKYKDIVIFGAGRVGMDVAEYLKCIDGINIICFAVSKKADNPDELNGIPVKCVKDITQYKESALVLIATYSGLHKEIKDILNQLDFKNILPIDFNEFQLYEGKMNNKK